MDSKFSLRGYFWILIVGMKTDFMNLFSGDKRKDFSFGSNEDPRHEIHNKCSCISLVSEQNVFKENRGLG